MPIVALQLNAFQVDSNVILNFTKVIDIPEPSPEEEQGTVEQADRAYWESYSNARSLSVVDKMILLVPNSHGDVRVTYNKSHIAVGTSGRNFLWCHPRKAASHCHMQIRWGEEARDEIVERLDEVGVFARPRGEYITLRINQKELAEYEELVRELVSTCEENSRG